MAHPDKSTNGKTIDTTKIGMTDYNPTPESSLDYLMSKYDLWEDKESGKYEPVGSPESSIPTTITDSIGPIDKLKDLTCSWWMLPKWTTDLLGKLTEGKTTWSITLYKCKKDTVWYLDIPHLLTYKEVLCGGTDETLDYWYKKLSGESSTSPKSKLKCTISSEPLEDVTTILSKIEDLSNYDDSTTYKDTKSGILCWLCPYLKWLYHGKPEKLYVKLSPV